jgi:hypothetical protein
MARVRVGVPLSCAALALIRSADYPESVRVYDEGHEPRSFGETDHAAPGLLWRHRRNFAEEEAIRAFVELHGRPPAGEELRDARNRWRRTLMSYPGALRGAVEGSCEALFQIADRSCPPPPGGQR